MKSSCVAVVYLLTNRVNGKTYVGLTRGSIENRWKGHVYTARTRASSHLHFAINKHGAGAFVAAPIASCFSVDAGRAAEKELIRVLAPAYNQTNGGEVTTGRRGGPELYARIAAANRGQKRTPEQRERIREAARVRGQNNETWREKVLKAAARGRANVDQNKRIAAASEACRNRIWTDESRAKLSASCVGRRYGREVIERAAAKHRKEVECVELKTVFASVSEAAEGTGISISRVSRICKGQRNSANGLSFRFTNSDRDHREV